MATRLYLLAALFGEVAERRRQARNSPFAGENIRALFADLKIRLEDSFCFTAEQKANIRIIAQNIIFQPTRTGFKSINIEVEKTLQIEKENMRLMNVFCIPARERQLAAGIRDVCSSVRNNFRQDIRDSITGPKAVEVAKFTYSMALKYKRGRIGDKPDTAYTFHIALLVFDLHEF
ncbi:hypothetical protein SERLA73DRAFT_148406 [Serpula lacrymans var. lacrymans S7.3]|uniref:Uncharacterized protein n=2 Tax=Serpula lacrymans var. lacrymans TaxID=341189 RepID=F8QJD6_SERL3|nr:uncharacterized protein SERLADRAFT_403735 [Serpula lacrymans var. lacrymans S7.9]EGN91584.1 hypothetical protein SERLA73DRAFT_148406 [Serpula lacrymans var. lacrymans S7.3]EGO18542.1 hypothetical protein SERLADRAFT_403735 [Serpula lacrymans var. lacrymans S7.9]